MNASELVTAVGNLRPELPADEHLRVALVLSQTESAATLLNSLEDLEERIQVVINQLTATYDQHAAVGHELDSLAATVPCEFTPDHVWTLVRALRIQTQIVSLYMR